MYISLFHLLRGQHEFLHTGQALLDVKLFDGRRDILPHMSYA